jgi:DNA-binding MarR family transcriptional regulator
MHRDERDIYGKPGHLIRRLQQIAVAVFVSKTQDFDITPVQYSALLALRNHPGIDQTSLMQIIAFDRSTIGEVVTRLARKGLIKRSVGRTDRRTRRLHLTPAGRRLLTRMMPINDEVQELILAPLTRSERAQFVRLMRKVADLNNEKSRAPVQIAATSRSTRP